MKAAFLIRCSTKRQDYQRQINDLSRLARRLGYEYSDATIYGEHVTGKDDATMRDRVSIARLKSDALAGRFDLVLVSEVSRMSRDPTSGRWYVRELVNWGIPVYFKDIDVWTYEPGTVQNPSRVKEKEMVIGAAFDAAWKYLTSLKTQVASGKRMKLEQGNKMPSGRVAYGYKRGKDGRIEIDEEQAAIVVEFFNEYLKSGSNIRNTSLMMSRKYGKNFYGNLHKHLIYEPYCTGKLLYTMQDPDTGEREDYVVELPKLISVETFEAAKRKRKANRTNSGSIQRHYIFSKRLVCPCCGHHLTPRLNFKKKAVSWKCLASETCLVDCVAKVAIDNGNLERVVWALVKRELIAHSKVGDDDRRLKKAGVESEISQNLIRIECLESDTNDRKALIDRAYRAFMDAPEDIAGMARENYYSTAKKGKAAISSNDDSVAALKAANDRLRGLLAYYDSPTMPEETIKKAEDDPVLKERIVTEMIREIVPFKIRTYANANGYILKKGPLLLEVHTVIGVYYVFYSIRVPAYYLTGDVVFSRSRLATESIRSLPECMYLTSEIHGINGPVTLNQFVELAARKGNVLG